MVTARTPRERWIEAGLQALVAGGPQSVRVESLARTLGVTKGGFYGYFADRQALLDEMLDHWEHQAIDEVIERVEREGGSARSRGRRSAALTFNAELWPIDAAIRDWARRDPAVAERLRGVDNRRMDHLRSLLAPVATDADDLEARCLVAFSVAIGAHAIAADHGERTRDDVVELITTRLFSQGPARSS